MDFGALLHVAKKNSESTAGADGKYYSTKFAPPKKESKDKKLSENIQKFLAKKENEERERMRIEKEKRDQLLALRDEKSKNKIKKMLKVIKSANKSVLADAVDTEHTAVTLNGPEQPDQDDYGYVSTEANAFYQKYIEKVKHVKEEKPFAPSRPASRIDLNTTKDRVKAAIMRENEEKLHGRAKTVAPKPAATAPLPRKHKNLYDPVAEKEMEEKAKREEQQKASKTKKPPPPAFDFKALLKLAEKKQFEPIEITVEPKQKEPERLLTRKEKKEMEELQRYKEEKEKRRKENEKATSKPVPEGKKMEPNGRIPKVGQSTSAPQKPSTSSSAPSNNNFKTPEPKTSSLKKPSEDATKSSKNVAKVVPQTKTSMKPGLTNGDSQLTGKVVEKDKKLGASPMNRPTQLSKANHNGPTREFPPRDTKCSSDPKQRQVTERTRQFPPPDVRKTKKPLERKIQKRKIYDDEDEYDSELDDFIDDGDEEEDYSQHIKAIFGYDKSKYRDDDDDDAMESTFAQQMREEYVSKKIGLMEDLEDMKQEAQEKKRKAMLKKRRV